MSKIPTRPLGDLIVDAQSGFASGAKAEDGIAEIRMNNITTDGSLDMSSIRRVPRDAVSSIEKYLLNDGDILFNATNSPNLVGKTARFIDQGEPFAFSNHFVRLTTDPNLLDSRYLARWLTLQQQQGVFELLCTRWVNQASVRKEDLLSRSVPLPPLAEQKRIVAILDQADALRVKRRAALARLDALVQSVFLEMFGGDTAANYPSVSVESVGKQIRTGPFGSQLLHSEFIDDRNGFMVLGIDNAVQNHFIYTCNRYISDKKYEQLKKYTVYPDDVLITIMGTCGRCAIVPQDIPLAINTKHLCCISLEQEMCLPIYLKHCFLMHPNVLRQLGVSERGAVMPGLNMGIIKNLLLPLPPIEMQKDFARIIHNIESLKVPYGQGVILANSLFSSLQQRAFRGEL